LKTAPGQSPQRIEHGFVLRRHADDVISFPPRPIREAANRQVVALGGTAGDDDLAGFSPDGRGDGFARCIRGFFGFSAKAVIDAASIAEFLCEERQHASDDSGIDAGGGVVVEINREGETHSSPPLHMWQKLSYRRASRRLSATASLTAQ